MVNNHWLSPMKTATCIEKEMKVYLIYVLEPKTKKNLETDSALIVDVLCVLLSKSSSQKKNILAELNPFLMARKSFYGSFANKRG